MRLRSLPPYITSVLSPALAVGLFFVLLAAATSGSSPDLEQRVSDLEARVDQLEETMGNPSEAPAQAGARGDWRDRANWRQLEEDMTEAQVRRLLGEPLRISGGPMTSWYYDERHAHANVRFTGGTVHSWTEPR